MTGDRRESSIPLEYAEANRRPTARLSALGIRKEQILEREQRIIQVGTKRTEVLLSTGDLKAPIKYEDFVDPSFTRTQGGRI
jgi:hypothetical protein